MAAAKIAELSPLAKQVNQKTDEINRVISTLNDKLAKLNLGIEVWLDHPRNALAVSDWEDEATHRERTFWFFGYDRLGDKWQLAVKEVTEELTIEDGEENVEEVNPKFFPLLSASRTLRLAALEQIPRLLDQMKEEGKKLLETVSAAEKLAESL